MEPDFLSACTFRMAYLLRNDIQYFMKELHSVNTRALQPVKCAMKKKNHIHSAFSLNKTLPLHAPLNMPQNEESGRTLNNAIKTDKLDETQTIILPRVKELIELISQLKKRKSASYNCYL